MEFLRVTDTQFANGVTDGIEFSLGKFHRLGVDVPQIQRAPEPATLKSAFAHLKLKIHVAIVRVAFRFTNL